MSVHESFEELVLSEGTPCDPEAFPVESAMAMLWATGKQAVAKAVAQTHPRSSDLDWERDVDELTGEGQLGTGEQLFAFVFQEQRCQAVASGDDGSYFIGVHHGLALVIPELVTWLFGTPTFLPWLGNVATLPALPLTGVPPGLQMLRSVALEQFLEDAQGHLPANARLLRELHHATDPVRHAAASYAISSAFRFMWLHEAAHLLLGHVDLCKERAGLTAISEAANDAQLGSIPDSISQMFEIQADTVALEMLIGREFSLLRGAARKGLADVPIPAGTPQSPLTPRQAALSNVLGCVLVSLVFHAQNKFLDRREEVVASHPPIWYRAETVLQHASETWGDDPEGEGMQGMLRAALQSLADVHPLFAEWFGQVTGRAHQSRCRIYRAALTSQYKTYGIGELPHKVHPSRRPQ